ncbi:MAG: SusC/RagA family TonB-linked outer membrane protein [Prolixibacteraceae bacterium]
MMKKIALLLVLVFSIIQVFSQERTISGKILDEEGIGLPGATVQLKGTTKGLISDMDGNYTISVTSDGGVLLFSYIGFISQEVVISESNVINVTLLEDVQRLEQVLVVGYGVQKKSLVTGAISKLDEKDISSVKVARIDQALQGKTSGVYVAQTSGSPGSPMSIKIRGNSSNGKNDPLFIVDGIKTKGIDFLSPSDIESIEVLKDAASAAIYGSEGGNGVVIISTKRAKKGASEINYNYYHGIQSVSNYVEMMNASEYIDYERQAYTLESGGANTTDKFLNKMAYYDAWDTTASNTNWMDQIISPASIDEHNLSFATSTEKSQMYLSATHYSQDGIIGGDKNNFTRYTFNLNADTDVKEWLNVGSKVTYSRSKKNNLNESSEFGGIVSNAMFFDPTVPVYYDDIAELPSNLQANPKDAGATNRFNALVKNDEGQYYHLSDKTTGETNNPLAQIYNTHNTTTVDKLLGDVHAQIKVGDHFKFNMKLALDYSLATTNVFTPKYYYNEEQNHANDTTDVTLRNTFMKQYKYSYENYATYNNSFGDHTIEVLAGFSYENYRPDYLDVTSYNVPHNNVDYAYLYNTLNNLQNNIPQVSGGMGTIDVNDPAGMQIINNYAELQNSYFGRFVYNYKEKYLAQANVRRDGSSLFAPNNRYGTFPSFSLGWNLGREDFFKDNVSFINSMKLRFSWGQNGNKQVLSPFQYTSLIVSSGIYYPDVSGNINSGSVPDNPGNPMLHWETSQQSDLGLEMTMLNSKLYFSMDLFDKRTKDQLSKNALVPLYLGFNNIPYVNSGEVQNKGVEFDLSYREMDHEFKYSVSFNASYIKNEVLSYGSEGTFMDGIRIGINDAVTRYEAGFPVYYFRGYHAIGVFQDEEDVLSYVNSEGKPLQAKAIPGDVKYEDSNNDGTISGSDGLNYLGKPMPDWTFGLNLSVEYKGFDLGGFLQGVTGNQIFFAAIRTDRLMFNKPKYYYDEMWTGSGTSNTIPRASAAVARYGLSTDNFNWSNNNVFDGDYLRLKNLTLGYTLPRAITSKIGISKLRVYLNASNVFTLTGYKGTDPEIGQVVASDPSTYGVDRGLYPASRVFTTGVNVTF